MDKSQQEEAIKLHKVLDKKEGLPSPNNLWPEMLIKYYNSKQKENINERNKIDKK